MLIGKLSVLIVIVLLLELSVTIIFALLKFDKFKIGLLFTCMLFVFIQLFPLVLIVVT